MITNPIKLGEKLEKGEDNLKLEWSFGKKISDIKEIEKKEWSMASTGIEMAIQTMKERNIGGLLFSPIIFTTIITTSASSLVLGMSITKTAVMIGVGGRGIDTLNKIRRYKLISKGNYYILKKT
ncbi:hypothetical protein [Staphylococcus hominis]|uniref:hypothetical protein n=1 Tax=Staphylococcus hominis TaxID=1290 RepID=UPI0031BB28D8